MSVLAMLGHATAYTLKINWGTLLLKSIAPWSMARGMPTIIAMATWMGIHGLPLKTTCMFALRTGIREFIVVVMFRTI